ncbi:XRE family transcriptional regulator [Desulfomicrobium salsuginis]
MITNERQYKITKAKLNEFANAIKSFEIHEADQRLGSSILAKAEFDALQSIHDELSDQVKEYEALKSGAVTIFKAKSINDLPLLLISARIAKGLSQRELAEALNWKEQQIQRYESDRYATANLKRLEEVASILALDISGIAEFRTDQSHDEEANPAIQWDLFPIKEMYLRRWFDDFGFDGSLSAAIEQKKELAIAYVQSAMPRRQAAFLRHKARFGTEMDVYALWAWQCRITLLIKNDVLPTKFSRTSLSDDWFKALVRLSQYDDGPLRARDALKEIGIHLVIEPHLPKTYLDGAAFLLLDGRPVIGMTIRYDRLDNFWFVLLHELVHVRDHLRKGKLESIFDDLESEPDELEQTTDQLAGDILIPDEIWETALPRYLCTKESVIDFAREIGLHPSIVAGRIRKDADNYVILSDLVGQRMVRKQFAEVQF